MFSQLPNQKGIEMHQTDLQKTFSRHSMIRLLSMNRTFSRKKKGGGEETKRSEAKWRKGKIHAMSRRRQCRFIQCGYIT